MATKTKSFLALLALIFMGAKSFTQEQQLTHSPKNHDLDGTQNFSADDRYLTYDTRGMIGEGIGNSQTIEKVDIATGEETVLYRPGLSVLGDDAAPGVGGPFYHPVDNRVAFIHGPPTESVGTRGHYAKQNRTGFEVMADGSMNGRWLDMRDVATDRDTTPGAHRGGTHVHQYSGDGRRIGFTYDDHLMRDYDRTIGYIEAHPSAPDGYPYYFALLIPTVPMGTSKPGEFERAWGDSWVDAAGTKRAFVGVVRAENGVDYEQSLFTVEISVSAEITTADSGGPDRFPSPPSGLLVRRLTQSWADGFVRASRDGSRIAYYGKDSEDRIQIFTISSDGLEGHSDTAKNPVQATRVELGVDGGPSPRIEGGLRWHPDGNVIAYQSNGAIVATYVGEGPRFGETVFMTPQDEQRRTKLVWSHDGKTLAYNRRVPTSGKSGKRVRTYDGQDFVQIFTLAFEDPFQ